MQQEEPDLVEEPVQVDDLVSNHQEESHCTVQVTVSVVLSAWK